MAAFIFRQPRLDTELHIHVGLQEIESNKLVSKTAPATIISLSPGGACLVLPKLQIEGNHLFFETLDSYVYNLLLLFDQKKDEESRTFIAAQSIWMDSDDFGGKLAFKVGVRFLAKQKNLYQQLQYA